MGYSLVVSPVAMALVAIPIEVTWSYGVGGVVFAIGLIAIFLRGEWRLEPKLDKLILFGPLFYAVPIAAFGTEHFTVTRGIASIVPKWIPWHAFWVYLVGACFIAAAFSLVTRIWRVSQRVYWHHARTSRIVVLRRSTGTGGEPQSAAVPARRAIRGDNISGQRTVGRLVSGKFRALTSAKSL